MRRLVLALVVLLAAAPGLAQVPQTIHYQGYLTNNTGVPESGPRSIVFSLYNAAGGGSALWTETQPSVQVVNGNYSVILGNGTPLTLSFDTQYYLGVKVGADAEMAPRALLTSSPYAFRARAADTATTAATVSGTVSGSQITGPIASANGTFTNGTFSGVNAGIAGLSLLGVRSVGSNDGCVIQGLDLLCGDEVCDSAASSCSSYAGGGCKSSCIFSSSSGGVGLGEPGGTYSFAPIHAPGEGEVTFTQTLPAVICSLSKLPVAIHFELRVNDGGATTTVGTAHANLPTATERQSPWEFIPQSTITGSHQLGSVADLQIDLLPAQLSLNGLCFLARQTRFNIRHISGSVGALD